MRFKQMDGRRQLRRGFVALLAIVGLGSAPLGMASAQSAGVSDSYNPPMAEAFDRNGMSLTTAKIQVSEPGISIGDPEHGGLSYKATRISAPSDFIGPYSVPTDRWAVSNLFGNVRIDDICALTDSPHAPCDITYEQVLSFSYGGNADRFVGDLNHEYSDGNPGLLVPLTPVRATGASATWRLDGGQRGTITYTAANGDKLFFETEPQDATWTPSNEYLIKRIEKPDGEIIEWHYASANLPNPESPAGEWIRRLQSVTNNLGYQIHFEYVGSTATDWGQLDNWLKLKRVTAINTAVYACDPSANSCLANGSGVSWPFLDYGTDPGNPNSETVTDALGRVTRFIYQTLPDGFHRRLVGVRSPGSASSNDISIVWDDSVNQAHTLTNASGTWTYTYPYSSYLNPPYPGDLALTVQGPNGYTRQIYAGGPTQGQFYDWWHTYDEGPIALEKFVGTDTINGKTTTYTYGSDARISRITRWEGDYSEYTYNSHGDVTRVRTVEKPSLGTAETNIYATYPEATAAMCVSPVTCNKPLTTKDALARVITYAYDTANGNLLSQTLPAPGAAEAHFDVSPKTVYTYDGDGTGIVRLKTTKTCSVAQTCSGNAAEAVTEFSYDSVHRLPISVTSRTGDSSVVSTSTMTYTDLGDVATVDGPIAGTGDKLYTYYDVARQLRATVSPSGGSQPFAVTRTTYDADGNPTRIERGTVSTPANWDALTVLARSDFAYDSYGRKTKDVLVSIATGGAVAVTQYSYDSAGRLECTAERMNPDVYGALTWGACAQSTNGSFGPDRITRTTYTADGDPAQIQTGYGTALVRNERTMTYLEAGRLGTIADAAGNVTTYTYDGFGRPKRTTYPVAQAGAAALYSEVSYDAAGNVVSERRRDGQMVYNTYDDLNRLRLTTPGADPTVTNDYDVMGRLIAAATSAGASNTFVVDALGRMTSETRGGIGAVSYQYDVAGRRTRMTWPDGFYVTYSYDNANEVTAIRENGAASGVGVLSTYSYDDLGRVVGRSLGNGGGVGYGYDAALNLSTLAVDVNAGGSALDQAYTYGYNPAGQLVSRSSSNPAYDWSNPAALTDSYTVNGLNQYTSARGASLSHDLRGNTTNDGARSYAYDVSNRLLSSSTGATAQYDAAGRLAAVAQDGASTGFLYDGANLIGEYNGGVLLRRYVHGPGVDQPIVWYDGAGTGNRHWLYSDERGSVIASEIAATASINRYDEYGVPAAANVGRFQYTGQTWLPEFGLYYYKARVYNASLGRFMQTDPIGYKDQINLYGYVGNDPIDKTDPTGDTGIGCILGGILGGIFGEGVGAIPGCAAGEGIEDGLDAAAIALGIGVGAVAIANHSGGKDDDPADGDSSKPQSDSPGMGHNNPPPDDPSPILPLALPSRTDHGQQRADEAAAGDSHREVGDPNRVRREGREFIDTETGNTVYVNGNRVVVVNPQGQEVSRFKQPRANTQLRIQSGKWMPR